MRFAAIFALAVALHAAGPRWPAGLDLYRPVPEDNRLTAAKIALGKRLFNENLPARGYELSGSACRQLKAERGLLDIHQLLELQAVFFVS